LFLTALSENLSTFKIRCFRTTRLKSQGKTLIKIHVNVSSLQVHLTKSPMKFHHVMIKNQNHIELQTGNIVYIIFHLIPTIIIDNFINEACGEIFHQINHCILTENKLIPIMNFIIGVANKFHQKFASILPNIQEFAVSEISKFSSFLYGTETVFASSVEYANFSTSSNIQINKGIGEVSEITLKL